MAKNGYKIFDSDMHIMEPADLWQRYIDTKYGDIAPRGRTSDNVRDLGISWPAGQTAASRITHGTPHKGHNYDRNQGTYADHSARGWAPEVQLEAMDAEGLDIAVLYPSRGLSVLTQPDMEPGFADAIARGYNDWLSDFCKPDPIRLLGAGMLSPYDVDLAIAEARRVSKMGFRAVFMRSNMVTAKPWHDPSFDPLWSVLEELDLPLGFHEASGSAFQQPGDEFDPNFMLRRVYAQPMTQMLAVGSFCAGGILERHPELRVAFLEANCSWLPWLLWRLDEGYEREADIFVPELNMAPTDYFKRQCWVSVEPDETPARYTIAELGADQIVFSTDYPHGDSRWPDSVDAFLELPISDEEKRKILWDNCARFYAMEVPASV
jgi:predicted TIM-barrel fold metal-dependent hydrolase